MMRMWIPSITPNKPKPAMPMNSLSWECKVWTSSGNQMKCITMWGCERAVIICMITLPMESCDRPKSLLLHCCIFPLAKYLGVVITFISGFTALLHWVGDVMRLQPQTSSLHDLICSISLTQCHSAFGKDFSYALFVSPSLFVLVTKLVSIVKVLLMNLSY